MPTDVWHSDGAEAARHPWASVVKPHGLRLRVEVLEDRTQPATAWVLENFNNPAVGLPPDWSSYPTQGVFAVQSAGGVQQSGFLTTARVGRAWHNTAMPADLTVRASVRVDRTAPTDLFLRGTNLNSERPNYYAVRVQTGGVVQLLRVQDGQATVLGTVTPRTLISGSKWVNVSLRAVGTQLSVQVQRLDSGQFLGANGVWSTRSSQALVKSDAALAHSGHAGVAHPTTANTPLDVDNVVLMPAKVPGRQGFDRTFPHAPAGWAAYTTTPDALQSTSTKAIAGRALAFQGTSSTVTRTWLTTPLPSDLHVRANVYADTLIPVEVLARGVQLDTATPSYYAATVVRGTTIKLLRVSNGGRTELATLTTKAYLSGVWLDVGLAVQGDHLQVSVQRRDTKAWLNATGEWQAEATAALNARDRQVTGSGFVGLARSASYAGTVHVDQLRISPPPKDIVPPSVRTQVTALGNSSGTVLSGFARLTATVQDANAIAQVQFLIDGELVARKLDAPYQHDYQTRNLPNGLHTLTTRAYDVYGNVGEATTTFTTSNPASFTRPNIPRHYSHIRYATLAYNGTPMGDAEADLLRNSVDLIIPNVKYLATINSIAPQTPQLIYTNLSNLYLELLTDWLNYADDQAHDREAAFYHVAKATPFTGDSPSSLPVNWLWNVQRSNGTTFKPLTHESRTAAGSDVAFGATGEALYLGYPERFRELTFVLSQVAGSAWRGVYEYPTAVDAAGRPAAWQTLPTLSDSTTLLRKSGTLVFDPPANWVSAVVSGSTARLYYLRVRTTATTDTAIPVAARIVGRDYVGAKGTTAGTIPAFDAQADTNRDGYLNNTEYAQRRSGFNARFVYESRLFYPYYGQMRFVTNPSGDGVSAWAADYHVRFLAKYPLADGVFVDNSGGRAPVGSASTLEATGTYASDYGGMLGAINRVLDPKWVMANTAGGGTDADRVTRQVPSIMEEFALRPLATTTAQFRDMAAMVARRLAISNPSSYIVLDTLAQGGSPTDPRTRMAALAYYYLLADPEATFLMTWGGEEPASAWSRHWWDALGYDIGQPQGTWSSFATGPDPANPTLTYTVFQRHYTNALVLYKPLAHKPGQGTGTTASDTATTHTLGGNYRRLNEDGSLGPVVNRVTLRNGDGAIMVRA